jgi:acid phosphatase family membrane protein YuiD
MAKTMTLLWRDKTVAVADIFGPGGMPSTHTCPIITAVVLIGYKEGWGSSLFALSCVLASVVMYDASGIRRAAGQHAQAINMIFRGLFEQGHLQDTQLTRLREILGHQPAEVTAGAVLGIVVGVAVNNLTVFGS